MATQTGKYAPYAPAVNIIHLIQHLRKRGWPDILNHQELVNRSLPAESTPRIIRALKFLGLIDDDGHPTPASERLRRSTDDEYPTILADVLRTAYSDVFTHCDPSAGSEKEVQNAFLFFDPQGQQNSMVRLFLGLCQEAKIVPEGTVSRVSSIKQTSKPQSAKPRRDAGRTENNNRNGSDAGPSQDSLKEESIAPEKSSRYALLHVLLNQLPQNGQWTQKRHDQWLGAVAANIDLLIEVVDNVEQKEPQQKLPL